jgi:P-type conjugative transfer protein TrbG
VWITRGIAALTTIALTVMGALAMTLPTPSPLAAQDTDTQVLDATIAATREYQKTGIARSVQQGDYLIFPYGKSQPTLTCSVLRACIIELQAGEQLTAKQLPAGDGERWSVRVGAWGTNAAIPFVIVKPLDCDLTTNLVIPTNRHLYDLTLDAPPCSGVNKGDTPVLRYTRRVRFYYPDEELAQWENTIPVGASVALTPEQLNYGYHWKADKSFPWSPEQVFDDGAHLYIKTPESARNGVAPVLFAVDNRGKTSIVNYTVSHDFYITDRVVPRAAFVLQIDGKERRVDIQRISNGGSR